MQAHAKVWFVSSALMTLSACAGEEVEDGRKAPPRTMGSGGYVQTGYGGFGSTLAKGGGGSSFGGNAGYGVVSAGTSATGGSFAASTGGGGTSAGSATAGNANQAGASAKAGAANSGPTEACPSLTYAKLPNGACTERVREYDIGATSPTNIVLGSDKRIWVDDDGGNQIIQLDSDGRAGRRVKCDEGSSPRALAGGKDADAVIWYTDWTAQKLIKVTKDLQQQATPLEFKASALALGAGNDIFLTEREKAIYRVQPNQPLAKRWESHPYESIVVSPDNNVWVTQGTGIGQLIPSTGVKDLELDEGFADGLCVGSDSAIWATDTSGSRLRRVTLDGNLSGPINLPTGTAPTRIITGPDGALWFAEFAQGMIGRFSPKTGEFTHYPLSTSGSVPIALTVGDDGYIWFTDAGTHKVGRLIPDPKQ